MADDARDWVKWLRKLRKRLGLSQVTLAAALGAHPSTVQKWEQGVSEPDRRFRKTLGELADQQ